MEEGAMEEVERAAATAVVTEVAKAVVVWEAEAKAQ